MTFWFCIALTWWLGHFISRYFKVHFMLIKYMFESKSQTLRMRYPFQSTGRPISHRNLWSFRVYLIPLRDFAPERNSCLGNNSEQGIFCKIQKTVNTWKFSGMLIVWWPITIMFRTCEQTSKPQTSDHNCCLRFSFLMPYWLFPNNTITFHKYFWCSRFCEFHS